MSRFSSVRKLDQAIFYSLELASSLFILLLAFGLIANMTNMLAKRPVFSNDLLTTKKLLKKLPKTFALSPLESMLP